MSLAGGNGTQTEPKGVTRRLGCAIAAAVVIVLVGLAGTGVHLYDRHWERKVEAKLAEFRAAGQPVTWDDVLARRREIPDEENSAVILLEAFEHLQPAEGHQWRDWLYDFAFEFTRGARHSEQARELVRRHLEANSEALRLIHQAAALPCGSYPLAPSANPWDLPLEHLTDVRAAAWLCAMEAAFHAEAGDAARATSSLLAGRAVAASLSDRPLLMEALVRIAADAIWLGSVERTLELSEFPAEELRMLRQQTELEDRQPSMEAAFCGDRAMGHWVFNTASPDELGSLIGVSAGWPGAVYTMVPSWRERDALYYYGIMDELIRAAALPPRRRLKQARALGARVEKDLGDSPLLHVFSGMLMPAIGRAVEEDVKAHARLQVARAALAAEEWRLVHGKWPDSLDVLVPDLLEAVPEDPFSTGPIRYERTEDGVLIYSVGADGEDDGGTSRQEAQQQAAQHVLLHEGWDLPFRLLNPELRGARTLTFREEVQSAGLTLEGLEEAGFTTEELKELGFSDEDLKELESRR